MSNTRQSPPVEISHQPAPQPIGYRPTLFHQRPPQPIHHHSHGHHNYYNHHDDHHHHHHHHRRPGCVIL